jgi:predicted kinase
MRYLVIVSGAPGAGKTTLAKPLARELEMPLLSKDIIKERLADSLDGPLMSSEWSRQLGGASMEMMWTLARLFPEVVLEANFRPHSEYERSRISDLGGHVVEIHCTCPPRVAQVRYADRAQSGAHHPVHVVHELPDGFEQEYDRSIGIGSVLEVDTTATVNVPQLAQRVNALQGRV